MKNELCPFLIHGDLDVDFEKFSLIFATLQVPGYGNYSRNSF